MTDWTEEEDEAFNQVERQSNLGKQILKAQGQPYHWTAEATKAAVQIEREECARIAEKQLNWNTAVAIRARSDTSTKRVAKVEKKQHEIVGLTIEEITKVMEMGLGVRNSIETALDKLIAKNK